MEHKIMLIQGENWIVLTLQDKVGGTLAKRVGTWREPTSDTSDGKEVYIVESEKPHLWEWTYPDPGVLKIGIQYDEKDAALNEGAGKFVKPWIILNGVTRSAGGRLGVGKADEKGEGKGELIWGNSRNHLLTRGPIKWSVIRYEH